MSYHHHCGQSWSDRLSHRGVNKVANTCCYNMLNFLPNPHKRPPITRLWGMMFGVSVMILKSWFMFCCCHHSAGGDIVMNWTTYNGTGLYFAGGLILFNHIFLNEIIVIVFFFFKFHLILFPVNNKLTLVQVTACQLFTVKLSPGSMMAKFCDTISMAWCKTAVTPLLTHWSYCRLALSPWYGITRPQAVMTASLRCQIQKILFWSIYAIQVNWIAYIIF